MRQRIDLRLTVLLVMSLLYGALAQEMSTRIYVLKARPAESTVELVRALLSLEGKAVAETRLNKLIVHDTEAVHAQVEKLLSEVDQHAPQVRIYVSMNGMSQDRVNTGLVGLNRNGVDGRVVISNTNSQVRSEQNVLVLSGERGLIHFSQDVVNPDPFFQFAVQAGLLPAQFAFQRVGTGFAVEPIVVEDVVRLRVTPWMSFVGANGANEVRVDEASSSFAVRSGDTVQISSGGYNQDLKNTAFGLVLGSMSRSSQGSSSIELRPVISDY